MTEHTQDPPTSMAPVAESPTVPPIPPAPDPLSAGYGFADVAGRPDQAPRGSRRAIWLFVVLAVVGVVGIVLVVVVASGGSSGRSAVSLPATIAAHRRINDPSLDLQAKGLRGADASRDAPRPSRA